MLRASKLVKFNMTIDRYEHGQNMTQMEDQRLVINDDGQFEGNEQQLVVSNAEDLVQVSSRGVIAEYQGKEWADEPELGITAAAQATLPQWLLKSPRRLVHQATLLQWLKQHQTPPLSYSLKHQLVQDQ